MEINLITLNTASDEELFAAADRICASRELARKEHPMIYGKTPLTKEKRFRADRTKLNAFSLIFETLKAQSTISKNIPSV